MPVFDYQCVGTDRHRFEAYLSQRDNPDPTCRECGALTQRLISRFAAIWTKNLSEYGDKRKETYHKDLKNEGHWVARKRSGGGTEDKPIFERITTVQEQAAYCKEEQVYNPSDLGPMEISKDGVNYSSRGLPGCW